MRWWRGFMDLVKVALFGVLATGVFVFPANWEQHTAVVPTQQAKVSLQPPFQPLEVVLPEPDSTQPAFVSGQIVRVIPPGDSLPRKVLLDTELYAQAWDTLAQPRFWQNLMHMSPDSSVINVAKTRQVLGRIPTRDWDLMREKEREAYRDSICRLHGLPDSTALYVTSGRNHFYRFLEVVPDVDEALDIFIAEGTDPWYAQAILLIESPVTARRSTAGAHGAFQLMKGVARELGLRVNGRVDERLQFDKSAQAAAKFLRRTCIPKTREMLDAQGLTYRESDLWFRLLVLHVYHAGARNVAGALRKLDPEAGGVSLILRLWQTEYRNFGNASQNYSQIVLATLLELDRLILAECRMG